MPLSGLYIPEFARISVIIYLYDIVLARYKHILYMYSVYSPIPVSRSQKLVFVTNAALVSLRTAATEADRFVIFLLK